MTQRSVEAELDLFDRRIRSSAAQLGERWPHTADPATGVWTTTEDGDWTGGYWSGMLAIAQATGREVVPPGLRARLTGKLRRRAADDTVSRGFLFYYGAALGAILLADQTAAEVACEGARALAGTFNPRARVIPVGARSEEEHSMGPQHVTIDGLVGTLPLLTWAAGASGEPELREVAKQDALGHIAFCLREDGSVSQSAEFDPRSGELLRRYTHKGLHANSTWARAQAWAILAFAVGARCFPEEREILRAACRAAAWWIARASGDDIVAWDFDAPAGSFRDSSASAIAAAGLLKLAPLAPPDEAARLREAGQRTVETLVSRYLTPVGPDDARGPGMLIEGCYNPHVGRATRHELIWGSYYLYEAVNVLTGRLAADRL